MIVVNLTLAPASPSFTSLSTAQDGDEVRLRDGEVGPADVLRERRRGPGEDLREPEAGEVYSLALADERRVAEHQLHHGGAAPHPHRAV